SVVKRVLKFFSENLRNYDENEKLYGQVAWRGGVWYNGITEIERGRWDCRERFVPAFSGISGNSSGIGREF
ncbi:MAG: hypothetical protein J6N32_13225, partial [Clostridia bacterium]|nr:hypothetical protein [Clostridia bacterium]